MISFFEKMSALFRRIALDKKQLIKTNQNIKNELFEVLILPKDTPDFMRKCKKFRGVYVNGCIQDGLWSSKMGEAHAHLGGQFAGFICAKNISKFEKRTTMAHELSHIATGQGHTYRWAKHYSDIDGMPKWLTPRWLARKYGFKMRGKSK